MKYEQGNLVLDNDEMSALACATWSDTVENKYEAREFVHHMALNKKWASEEIKKIERAELGEREKIIVETLRLAIKSYERFEKMAHELVIAAGESVSLH